MNSSSYTPSRPVCSHTWRSRNTTCSKKYAGPCAMPYCNRTSSTPYSWATWIPTLDHTIGTLHYQYNSTPLNRTKIALSQQIYQKMHTTTTQLIRYPQIVELASKLNSKAKDDIRKYLYHQRCVTHIRSRFRRHCTWPKYIHIAYAISSVCVRWYRLLPRNEFRNRRHFKCIIEWRKCILSLHCPIWEV